MLHYWFHSFQLLERKIKDKKLVINLQPPLLFPGQEVSWDDFLPALSYVIVECNRPHILIEVEYMMELLEPSWLGGEGTAPL